MNKEMKKFLYIFIEIRKMGYIENVKKTSNGAGLTFEKNINKSLDNASFPDICGIEIKVKHKFSKQKVHLICMEPDALFDTYKLTHTFGYLPKDKDNKYFYVEINAIEKIRYIKNYFQLYIDEQREKIILLIYDAYGNMINNEVTWSFYMIKERLQIKLNTLALIFYLTRKHDDKEYYYYRNLTFYQDIDFEQFLQALKSGLITIKFTINVNVKTDKIKNHGTEFSIDIKDLPKIYKNKY